MATTGTSNAVVNVNSGNSNGNGNGNSNPTPVVEPDGDESVKPTEECKCREYTINLTFTFN
jgi:hypothetical protein